MLPLHIQDIAISKPPDVSALCSCLPCDVLQLRWKAAAIFSSGPTGKRFALEEVLKKLRGCIEVVHVNSVPLVKVFRAELADNIKS